jgi:hypothetical protein
MMMTTCLTDLGLNRQAKCSSKGLSSLGKHTATTNAAFDADLKQRDPRWGVRDVDDIVSEAVPNGLGREVVDMLANNLSSCSSSRARQNQLEFAAPTVRFPRALRAFS